ncbi:uncharacterized protein LOC129135457 isoform X2 [Pan troglodytes]|uniref:uncharacterized protein LOC129135457 isoform X2 n=1 Tax=Pan troglodytes TaxID=9598 RepID=UPI003013708D
MSGEVSWMQAVCAGTRAPATDEVAGVHGSLLRSSRGFQGRLTRFLGRRFMTAEFLLEDPSSGSINMRNRILFQENYSWNSTEFNLKGKRLEKRRQM